MEPCDRSGTAAAHNRTSQSELQWVTVPSGPSLPPSYSHAHPLNAQMTGLIPLPQMGQDAVSLMTLKACMPCTQPVVLGSAAMQLCQATMRLQHAKPLQASPSCPLAHYAVPSYTKLCAEDPAQSPCPHADIK